MKKSDLKSGMWIDCRNGERFLILANADTERYGKKILVGIRRNGFISIHNKYSEHLLRLDSNSDYDIMKVYYNGDVNSSTYECTYHPLYWERKEEPKHTELSISEIEEKLQLPSGTLRIKKEPNG